MIWTTKEHGWVTAGVVIAVIPAIIYLFSFYHEAGCAVSFGIPGYLVVVQYPTVAFIGLGIITILLSISPAIYSFKIIPTFAKIIALTISFALPIIALGFVLKKYPDTLIKSLIIGGVLFILILFQVIISSKPKLRSKFKLGELGILPVILLALMLAGIYLSYYHGKAKAEKQSEFLVIKSSPEMVVLRKYGNNFICSEFNRDTKERAGDFHLISIEDEITASMKLEEVGPFLRKE